MVLGTVYPACAWWAVGATGGGVAVAGGGTTTACAGFSTDCATTGNPTNSYLRSSGTSSMDCQRWTATRSGTATRIRQHFNDYYGGTEIKVGLYNGTTKIGSAAIVGSTGAWVWSSDLIVEGGQSLTFALNDVLRICVAVNTADANGYEVAYSMAAAGNYWDAQTSYLPATASWSTSDEYIVGVQLEYEY